CFAYVEGRIMAGATKQLRMTWRNLFEPGKNNRWPAFCFWLVLLLVTVLLCTSGYSAIYGANRDTLIDALLGGSAGFAATALGALLALVLHDISARTQDTVLGFAAGMMLAASSFSLILPGIEAAQVIHNDRMWAAFIVVLGLGLGAALMMGLERFVPHEHQRSGVKGPETRRISRIWLFVLAITLHNLPEGMAIGVTFASG